MKGLRKAIINTMAVSVVAVIFIVSAALLLTITMLAIHGAVLVWELVF